VVIRVHNVIIPIWWADKTMFSEEEMRNLREQMVEEQIRPRGIIDSRVLDAMRIIPRHLFVPPETSHLAYNDGPLPIGERQTISQPYIVALMSQLLRLTGTERVLEIGTGCGYQTAVLCEIASYVYSLERYVSLAETAAATLDELGYDNVDIHIGDGSQGLADMGPFDAIIVTAAAPSVPGPLCSQLHNNSGRLVVPVGDRQKQTLQVVYNQDGELHVEDVLGVRFVPLVGRYGFDAPPVDDDEDD
jgi:protein-L-isoaspartate(D-aspartate) O-methyltransferase